MNINDVTKDITIPTSKKEIWIAIFKKQRALAYKYSEIEGMGDLLDTTYNNINTAKGQKWIKDFAWRVTEELAEADEAGRLMNENHLEGDPETGNEFKEHYKEELIDALHFLVELTIIAGHVNLIPKSGISSRPWDVVYNLGLMCNTLKNKPWKQTQMLTDRPKFTEYLNGAWTDLYNILLYEIGDDKEIYKYYFKKNKVNQFRQRSKY